MKIGVIGGGAAGFFAALTAKRENPKARVTIYESSLKLLSKVKISGGGRCNVTTSCFDPKELVKNYPRGKKELLGPFHAFGPKDTEAWFAKRGVLLQKEKDGRMFPESNSSETIINCFLSEAEKLGVVIETRTKIQSIQKKERFLLQSKEEIVVDALILATGSSQLGFVLAKSLGHTIIPPVPSLFTFNVPHFSLVDLAGVSVNPVRLKLGTFIQEGPLLITHWGFSGPAALKLSAFAARHLAEKNYEEKLHIDWLPEISEEFLREKLLGKIPTYRDLHLPKNLFRKFFPEENVLGKKSITAFLAKLKRDSYDIRGKTTHKEEFVTAGGVNLSEVNFKTMESKICQNLYFCGEILDVDGVTGGFNFQNAWTSGFLAGNAIVKDRGALKKCDR